MRVIGAAKLKPTKVMLVNRADDVLWGDLTRMLQNTRVKILKIHSTAVWVAWPHYINGLTDKRLRFAALGTRKLLLLAALKEISATMQLICEGMLYLPAELNVARSIY